MVLKFVLFGNFFLDPKKTTHSGCFFVFANKVENWYYGDMTIDDVDKLAELARIEMSEEEKQEFLENMESILKYVDVIQTANTDDVVLDIGDVYNVMRADIDPIESGVNTEKILEEMPATQNGFLKVKKIL